jgi:probable HAF family extracellular repeat protein
MQKKAVMSLVMGVALAAAAASAHCQIVDFETTRVPTNFFGPGLETRGGTVVQGLNDSGQYVGTFGERNWVILGTPHAFIHGSQDRGAIAYDPEGSGQSRSVPEGYRLGLIPGEAYPDPGYRYLDLFPSGGWSEFNDRVTRPLDINNHGVVVGSISSLDYLGSGPATAFRYDSESRALTLLAVPGAVSSEATGINNLGQIVGNFTDTGGAQRSFLFSEGMYTVIDRPGYESGGTRVGGINDAGAIVGSSYDFSNGSSFIYRSGAFEDFTVNGLYTVAADINNDEAIVGWVGVSGQRLGFYRAADITVILDLSEAGGSTYAYSINGAGRIGGAVDSGAGLGFLATVSAIPEPSTLTLWLIAALCGTSLRRRASST